MVAYVRQVLGVDLSAPSAADQPPGRLAQAAI